MTKALRTLSAVALLSLVLGACQFDDHKHEAGSLVGQECEYQSIESAVGTLVL